MALAVCSFCYVCETMINKGDFEGKDYKVFFAHLKQSHGWREGKIQP